jgi:hypothetical protein
VRVNKRVNETVKPLSDLEHWGVTERWSYPDDGYGDCEDYGLLKRRMLIQSGWPREALLVTVVHDKNDQGHAVGPVAGLVGIEGGVVSGVFNLESPGVEALGRRPRHEECYQPA